MLERNVVPRRPWTLEEYELVAELRAKGVKWAVIAERTGRRVEALQTYWSRVKSGDIDLEKRKRLKAQRRERLNRMIDAVHQGIPIGEIAKQMGMTTPAVGMRLFYHGYDAEVRNEYRS